MEGVADCIRLRRFEEDGFLDTTVDCDSGNGKITTDSSGGSFDGDGEVTTSIGTRDTAYALAIGADGEIVVSAPAGGDFGVARYNSDGSLDTTFSGDGTTTLDFGSADNARGGSDPAGWEDRALAGRTGQTMAAMPPSARPIRATPPRALRCAPASRPGRT